jgi:outer membrane biosynthesis protein TonB
MASEGIFQSQVSSDAPDKKSAATTLLAVLVGLLVLGLIAWGLMSMMGKSEKPADKKPPKITLVAPPPPPPPPPPKFEKKPDPPKEQKEMKVDQPVVKQEQAPPTPELKMEGPAGDGPSAFGAGKVSNEDMSKIGKSATGPVGTGGPSGAIGSKSSMLNPLANYANMLKGEMQRYLSKNNALKRRRYAIDISVWVSVGGGMERFELLGTSGDTDTDAAIKKAISELPGFTQAPPAGMPQPIRLRIITSGN